MRQKLLKGFIGAAVLVCLSFSPYVRHAESVQVLPPGTTLPQFTMQAPEDPGESEYLGLKSSDPFSLSQISAKLVIIDFVNVF